MSWNIQKPGDYINGPLTVAGVAQFNSNVGVGVAPSAWNSNYNAIDIGANGSVSGRLGASNTVDITSNAFRNSAGDWVYKIATSSPAARYQVDGSSGSHIWYSGVAGTAGNTIAGFSTALMTLSSVGLLVGASASGNGEKFNANGTIISTGQSIGGFALNQGGFDYATGSRRLRVFSGTSDATASVIELVVGASGTFNNGITLNPSGLGVGVTPSAGKGCLQLSSGINFPATQVTSTDANTLDDYEEGNWTVGLSDLFGNDGTVSAQTGRYVKIGRRVFCFGNITLSNKGAGAAGNLPYIVGLPFQAIRTEGSVVQFYANTSLTTNGQINFQTAAGNNVGNFTVASSTTGTTFLTFAQITNTTQLIFCFSYDVS
jgi:hypothetical protein